MPYIGAPRSRDKFETLKEKLCLDKQKQSMENQRRIDNTNIEHDQEEQTSAVLQSPLIMSSPKQGTPSSLSSSEIDSRELLTFPNESTHAYSYNPLSPNSLAVRLRILKRSLEIMIRNPTLLQEHRPSHHVRVDTPNGSQKEFNFTTNEEISPKMGQEISRSYSQDGLKPLSTSQLRNASSAALSALVTNAQSPSKPFSRPVAPFQMSAFASRPSTGRTNSSCFDQSSASKELGEKKRKSMGSLFLSAEDTNTIYKNASNQSSESLNAKRSELEGLLVLLNDALENNRTEKASDLHMISLLNLNKLSLDVDQEDKDSQQLEIRTVKYEQTLKRNLLESLAQPFFENSNTGEGVNDAETYLNLDVDNFSNDSASFANLKTTPMSNRLLHTFVSSKNSSPQAIFTCLQQYPWQFKSANDLACLTFGISKNALRALTLLDLIHSDSRKFVLNKIMSTENQELAFTGEIVAIVQPGDSSSELVWSSVWAKRRNGLIFCVFEKVPCDFMDVLLNLDDFSVDHIAGGAGLKGTKQKAETYEEDTSNKSKAARKSVKFPDEVHDVGDLSKSLKELIRNVESGVFQTKDSDLLPMSIRVADAINEVRYFTLNHLSFNIPCAISSSILESEMKLKIHSMPYQAGIFFIDSKNFKMVSFNKSISKNMFGIHASGLLGKSMNVVIPSFGDLINFIRIKYPSLDTTLAKNKGLVLTEHFFRKIQAEMNNDDESFFDSIGIDAIHRDGSIIKVDIQLRVISSTNSLLWITHSRDVVFENYKTNPSQLLMLKESELAVVGSGTTSRNSLKSPNGRLHVDDLPNLKDSLKLDGSTVGSFDGANGQSQHSIEESPETPTDDRCHEESGKLELQKLNDEITAKLNITKNYGQDKSLFLKDNNFKLDEDLILSLSSISPSKGDNGVESARKNLTAHLARYKLEDAFLATPEHSIGALKHVKKFSDFMVLQKMGEGAYGKVDLCMHKKDKYIVVIKLIFKERILVDTWVRDRKLGTIPSEIQIMATLNTKPHENILMLLDFFEDDDYYFIETPVHGTSGSIDLFDLIELKTDMTEHEARLIFKQIVSGIKHLHDNGIVHRDIKDENVIVDSNGFVKIVDFGSAAYVKSGPFDVFVGTIDYAAPEVLGGEPYEGKPQDIWAIGILLYTIIFKENPFYNIDEILDADLRINTSQRVSDECIALIRKILNRSVSKRPSIDEINGDKWLEVRV
ncbi:LANO_0C02498g1_1 [Lachancea nothofagi CBS 11611]|uniref:non-specific serine/threonine protein kinase n=1 Tax=Lachancea nothofagi CBS 11611 TaxID=1266666 RepID=A0A1G4J5H8_9SACH|nr:LANO_0C02498g1_1 [Lachancea nothofagi CBS 11611]